MSVIIFWVIIGLIAIVLITLAKTSQKDENRVAKWRNNLVIGNKCNIRNPSSTNQMTTVEIVDIKGDIVYVSGSYMDANNGYTNSLNNKPIPRNEIFPYE